MIIDVNRGFYTLQNNLLKWLYAYRLDDLDALCHFNEITYRSAFRPESICRMCSLHLILIDAHVVKIVSALLSTHVDSPGGVFYIRIDEGYWTLMYPCNEPSELNVAVKAWNVSLEERVSHLTVLSNWIITRGCWRAKLWVLIYVHHASTFRCIHWI